MADVYKEAKMGLSWMGEEYEDSSLTLRMIRKWASLSAAIKYKLSQGELSAFFENKLQDEIFMPRSVTALKNMLHRLYWQRLRCNVGMNFYHLM
ncbi:uncharacterized protein Bfra_008441 [Botrytis fragariae]|uniref:Uncharacterized protein n=1 Tax=Botrytis fragariae TaxID=1964551 RepID=A0A8H6AT89_9HELO|nr:uncharacterized protein Bfra_008441 [Botrytis fragariae]KAF5873163.1 hypothetical protein Bfra_008441 [Botrytis fragariae]